MGVYVSLGDELPRPFIDGTKIACLVIGVASDVLTDDKVTRYQH